MIKIEMTGIMAYRDVALRAVQAACKLVTPQPYGPAWNTFQLKVVSAVGEAFNNIVQHGYKGNGTGKIELDLGIGAGQIEIDLRDWGTSFDPKIVPAPDLAALPESGLGLYIIHSFVDVEYRPGCPNILKLSKTLDHNAQTGTDPIPPAEGDE